MPHSPTHRPYYDEWTNSVWSTADNYMPYREYEALRIRKEANQSYKAATSALKKANKLKAEAKKAVKGSR